MKRAGKPAPVPTAELVVRGSLGALAALVVVFHAELLLGRIRDASIAEPLVSLRWLAALALAGTAAELRRRGVPLLRGRAGAVLFVTLLLLHAGAVSPQALREGSEHLLVALPIGLAALGISALAAPARARGGLPAGHAIRLHRPPEPPRRRRSGALPSRFAPRPPPAR